MDKKKSDEKEAAAVEEHGDAAVSAQVDWQPILERINWEDLHTLIHQWGQRGTAERKAIIHWTYGISVLTIIVAGSLAYKGIIQGQAITGFLGAVIGYLLSRSKDN